MELTFATFTAEDGASRLAVFIDGQVVCRAPSLRASTKRHTEPGAVVWVLSENSKSLGRLERQLRDGARVLRTVKGAKAKARVKASVLTGVSFLSEKDLMGLKMERAEMAASVEARKAERAAKKKAAPAKKKSGPLTKAAFAKMEARIAALEAEVKAAQG